MERRTLLKGALGVSALSLGSGFWRAALAIPSAPGPGPYGPLGAPDANGLMLPAGFTSTIIGISGLPVTGTTYVWHTFPDGASTFPTADGGWILVSNSEVPAPGGGAGAVVFGPDGQIRSAHRILENTGSNCAGGATPWGTWLSCEESDAGQVWECDPTGTASAVARPALGRFAHEAAAVDPDRGHVYLTEDDGASLLYRFTPDTAGDLSSGVLEAAAASTGKVRWLPIADPSAAVTPTREQPALSADAPRFRRGEGMWFDSGIVYFTTTSADRVWAYSCARRTLDVVYDAAASDELALHDPDNITVHAPSGDLFVGEDADNLELVVIAAPAAGQRESAPFLRLTNQDGSEVTGLTFDPSGQRLYFSSQRGGPASGLAAVPGAPGQGLGVTYEIRGPFRHVDRGRH
jgi:uncharacterized protein